MMNETPEFSEDYDNDGSIFPSLRSPKPRRDPEKNYQFQVVMNVDNLREEYHKRQRRHVQIAGACFGLIAMMALLLTYMLTQETKMTLSLPEIVLFFVIAVFVLILMLWLALNVCCNVFTKAQYIQFNNVEQASDLELEGVVKGTMLI